MSTSAFIGHGATFGIGNGATPTEAFTTVAEVTSISMPSLSRDTVDVTDMASTERYRQFIAGLRDGGEVELELALTAAGYTALLAKYNQNAANNYKITLPDSPASSLVFSGLLTDLPGELPLDDKSSLSVTFKVSGKPTWTPGS